MFDIHVCQFEIMIECLVEKNKRENTRAETTCRLEEMHL